MKSTHHSGYGMEPKNLRHTGFALIFSQDTGSAPPPPIGGPAADNALEFDRYEKNLVKSSICTLDVMTVSISRF